MFGYDCSDLIGKIEDVYGMVSRSRLGRLSFLPLVLFPSLYPNVLRSAKRPEVSKSLTLESESVL